MLEKCTHCSHAKEQNSYKFPKEYLSDKELPQFYPKANWSKFNHINKAHWKNLGIYNSRHETLLQVYTQFWDKHNI